VDYRVLGPLEVLSDGEPLPLGGPKQRAVLALLLLHPNEVVAVDTMIDELWGGQPPKSVEAYVQNCISRLRKALGREAIERRAPGYVLRVDARAIDAVRFERAVEAAAALDPAARAAALREALALWHGPPLADFGYDAFAQTEIARLDELRLAALEQQIAAELALGRHEAVLGQVQALVRRHPSRERLRELQMLALYRAGRQRDALRAYQEARLELLEHYGLEPGEALRALERMVISHDPALQLHAVADAAPATELTSGAVVLVLEVAAVTDAGRDAVASVLADTVLVVERHEGAVHEREGDRTAAVFGIPVAHDDDTLRALRAAYEVRAAAAEGVEIRAALERGADVAGVDDLLARAAAGEVVVGPAALQLVPAAVDVVPHESGRGYRVLRFDPTAEPIVRQLGAPLVGRSAELAELEAALAAAADASVPRRIALVGDAGIGKTRLARELIARVESHVTVVVGRCAPYGDEAALLPLRQILDQIGQLDAALTRAADADVVASKLGDRTFADRGESFWALRRLLESVAATRPLLVVLEDVHWATPVLLDLVEYLAGWAVAPILLLCVTRPELLDARPEWRDDAIFLQPLARADAEALVRALPHPPAETAAAVDAAEGNPLFLEQLAAFAAEEAGSLPPTLDVLIRSRVERLPTDERAVLEHASVVGRHFWRSTVEASFAADGRAGVGRALMALARRRLVHPEQASVAGEDGFRFHHALVRDSVYRAIGEPMRAKLHETVARAIDARGGGLDEIVGYHLEHAARGDPALAREAANRLGSAGMRALRYHDPRSAIDLLERARALAGGERVLELECALATAIKFSGRLDRASPMLEDVAQRAASVSNEHVEYLARVEQVWSSLATGALSPDDALDLLRRAHRAFRGDDYAQARALHLEAALCGTYRFRAAAAEAAARRALDHYVRAGAAPFGALTVLAVVAWRGPRAVDDAAERCRAIAAEMETPAWTSFVLPPLAALEAMRGNFDDARAHLEEARRGRREFSDTGTIITSWAAFAADVELAAGDPTAAERILSDACERLRSTGDREWLATNGAILGDALVRQERHAEALAAAETALTFAPPDHLTSRSVAGRVSAVALAGLDRLDDAASVATETLAALAGADVLAEIGAAHAAAARVHALAGATAAADEHRVCALDVFERKGDVVAARRLRAEIAPL
jgi:DNA-binding SARP family transcriptional activator